MTPSLTRRDENYKIILKRTTIFLSGLTDPFRKLVLSNKNMLNSDI